MTPATERQNYRNCGIMQVNPKITTLLSELGMDRCQQALTLRRFGYSASDDLTASSEEVALLSDNLLKFWQARHRSGDALAPVGIALWGTSVQLREQIKADGPQSWKPELGVVATWLLKSYDRQPPQTDDEILAYWNALGTAGEERLYDAMSDKLAVSESSAQRKLAKDIGLALAMEHYLRTQAKSRPLTAYEVAQYHQEVFKAFDLPKETYSGTPFRWLPDFLEVYFLKSLYWKDCP